MFKSVSALLPALVAAAGFVGATAGADAHYRHGGCCGPLPTVYSYSDVNKVEHRTRYQDVWKNYTVYQPQLHEHITRVHPVIYVNDVLRVHHHEIDVVRAEYVGGTTYARPEEIVTHSVENLWDCICKCK